MKRSIATFFKELKLLQNHKTKINELRFENIKVLSNAMGRCVSDEIHTYSKLRQLKTCAYENLLPLEETETLLKILKNPKVKKLCEHYDKNNFSDAIFIHYQQFYICSYDKEKVNELDKIFPCNLMLIVMNYLERIKILEKIY